MLFYRLVGRGGLASGNSGTLKVFSKGRELKIGAGKET